MAYSGLESLFGCWCISSDFQERRFKRRLPKENMYIVILLCDIDWDVWGLI